MQKSCPYVHRFIDLFTTHIKNNESGALPGLMLELVLLKIIWEGIFPIFNPFGELYPCRTLS